MEYVEGRVFHRYCDARSLSPQRPHRHLPEGLLRGPLRPPAHDHPSRPQARQYSREEGRTPKLLDFGIAKLLDPEISEAIETTLAGASRIVTPAYASPEQMRGEAATVRSDIFSLVLCCLRSSPAAAPRRIPQRSEQLDHRLPARDFESHAVSRRLAERYDSVETFAADIQRCMEGSSPAFAHDTNPSTQTSPCSVAVLPFRVLASETSTDGYLGIGITDAVVTKLSNVGRISVRPTSAVMRYAQLTDAITAGRELNVEFVVEGRIQKTGNRVRATVQLVRVRTGLPDWAGTFDEEVEDLLKVEDSISSQVARALIPQLKRRGAGAVGAPRHSQCQGSSVIPPRPLALEPAYRGWPCQSARLLHAGHRRRSELRPAHAGVADYYIQLGAWGGLPPHESFAAARQAANRALEIDSSLAEAHASLGFAVWAYDRDAGTASHEFQLAIALNPDYSTAHHWLGLLNSARGRPEMAIASLERARKLDPYSPILSAALSLAYSTHGSMIVPLSF